MNIIYNLLPLGDGSPETVKIIEPIARNLPSITSEIQNSKLKECICGMTISELYSDSCKLLNTVWW